jgi:PAS domain S-box-containing protein
MRPQGMTDPKSGQAGEPRAPATGDTDTSIDALTLDAILETAAAGIVSIDARGIMRTVNPATQRLFGYTRAELIGRNVSMLTGGSDRANHDHYIQRYLRTRESRIMGVGREVTGVRKDGTAFQLHLSIGEFVVGGETFFTGVLIDLTKEKRAEQSLAHQQALFRAVFDCLPDPLLIRDVDNKVQKVNPAFTRTFGLTPDDLVGGCDRALFASDADWQRHHAMRGTPCTATPDFSQHVIDFRRAGGEVFPGAVVSTEIATPERQRLGFLELIRDISGERRREAQLMQAQRMEAIGQLTGGIAHDFNNILTVVLGNVELIEMRLGGNDAMLSLAREAREAAEIGARLTDRLLTFGRRQLLETRRINLNEFVLGLIELLRRSIGEDIDLSTALASNLALTEVDPGQVENALLNLAINARDAMPKGGRLVIETRNVTLGADALATTPELSPGRYVVLSVSDTGHGMTPDVKARAFEPFFTTKATGKGSGLGLATIYGFAKQSGGHVTITSAVGRGTTVELFLPAVAETVEEHTVAPTATGAPLGGGRRVLVVEDNDSVRRLTSRRLVELGYVVDEAPSAVEALEVLASHSGYDLVFTDVVMPGGLSGLDLAREVSHHFPHIAVVLTTGYAEQMLTDADLAHTEHVLIRKPYHQVTLARALAEALEQHGAVSGHSRP